MTKAIQAVAKEINAAIAAAEDAARDAVAHARRAGELLIEAKATVPSGEWTAWVKEHVSVSLRTAQAYMRLSRKLAELPEGEAQRVALLPLRLALDRRGHKSRSSQ